MEVTSNKQTMKLDILAFGAHPDDVELSCAGTILKHISVGKKTGIVDLTKGELGTRGNAAIRMKEAAKAAKILGVTIRENLNFADGFFQNDKKHQLEIIKIIRKYQPEIVLANALTDRHPDHSRGSQLISEACFYSGLIKIKTGNQKTWRPKAMYHYIQDRYIKPDFVIDVSAFMEKKLEAIAAFSSQFYNPKSNEPETPLTSPYFSEFVKARASNFGRIINVQYAEGFVAERSIGVNSFFDLL